MTRTGKIARLPLAIRLQLNQRLQNGEVGTDLVRWLNSLPEVQAILAAQFGGQPINGPNLSEWKQGGYRDWASPAQASQAALSFLESTADLPQTGAGSLTDRLRAFCAAHLTMELQRLDSLQEGPEKRAQWRVLFTQMALLCQGDRAADRAQLQREHLQLQRENTLTAREEQFWQWAKTKENRVAFGLANPLTDGQKQALRKILDLGPAAENPISDEPGHEPAQTAPMEDSKDETSLT